nr:fap1 adhesin-like [Procambarus clarkii]
MDIKCLGNPKKRYTTCKFWTRNKCKNHPEFCKYVHSYVCPERDQCERFDCTLLHVNQAHKKLLHQKTVTQHAVSKKPTAVHRGKDRRTSLPEASTTSVFKWSSISPNWRFKNSAVKDNFASEANSSPFDCFDEELCKGLEEVGQELDRFTEEASESSHCDNEVICLTEVNSHYSEHSSPSTAHCNKNVVKRKTVSEAPCELKRNPPEVASEIEILYHTKELVHTKKNAVKKKVKKDFQGIMGLKSQTKSLQIIKPHQRDVLKLEEENKQDKQDNATSRTILKKPLLVSDSQVQDAPSTSLGSPPTVALKAAPALRSLPLTNTNPKQRNFLVHSSSSHTSRINSADKSLLNVSSRIMDGTVSQTSAVNETVSQTPAVNGTVSQTPAVNETVSQTSPVNGTISQTPAVNGTVFQTPTVNGTVSLTPAVNGTVSQTPAVTVTVSLTPAVNGTVSQTSAVNETVSQTPAVNETVSQTPTVNGTVSQTSAVNETVSQTPAVNETVSQTPTVNGTVSQTSPVNGTVSQTSPVNETVSQTPVVNETVSQTSPVNGTVSQTSPVNGTVSQTSTVNGTVSQTSPVNETVSQTPTVNGTVSQTSPVNETVSQTPVVNETVSQTTPVNGTVSQTSAVNETVSQTSAANETVSQTAVIGTVSQTAVIGTVSYAPTVNGTVSDTPIVNGTVSHTSAVNGIVSYPSAVNETVPQTPVVNGTVSHPLAVNGIVSHTPGVNGTVSHPSAVNETVSQTAVNGTVSYAPTVNGTVSDTSIVNGTVSCQSAVDTKEAGDSGYKTNLSTKKSKIINEPDKALQELKYSNTNIKLPTGNSSSDCPSHDSSFVSKDQWPVSSSKSSQPINQSENSIPGGGDEGGDKVCELKALLSQKKLLVNKIKSLVKEKKNLCLQRDNVMNNFSGDTTKLSQYFEENSQVTKKVSAQILIFNAEIKLTNQKINDLENSKSLKKAVLLKDDTKEEQESVLGCFLSSKTQEQTHQDCFNNNSENTSNKEKMFEKNLSESRKLSHETEKLVNIHHKDVTSLTEEPLKGNLEIQTPHLPEQERKKEELPQDKQCGEWVQVPLIEHKTGNSICNIARSSRNITSHPEQLRQAQLPYSVQENNIVNKPVNKDDSKCDKTSPHKAKMSDSSKDLSTHWCRLCNVFFTHICGFVKHLESSSHMEKLKEESKETWVQKMPQYTTKNHSEVIEGKSETVGAEFLHSTKIFICELCESILWNAQDAALHPQSSHHAQKYKEHVQKNTDQERSFLTEKMNALTKYFKERKARSQNNPTKETSKVIITEGAHKQSENGSRDQRVLHKSESPLSHPCGGLSKKRKSLSLEDYSKRTKFA